VVVTGTARLVTDPAQLTRYEQMLLLWVDKPMDCVIRIQTHWPPGTASTTRRTRTPRRTLRLR